MKESERERETIIMFIHSEGQTEKVRESERRRESERERQRE